VTPAPLLGSFEALAESEPYPGLRRRTFDAAGATVNEYRFEPDATFPLHHHPEEQITLVTEGEVELTAAGETARLRAGDWSVVAGGVEHGIRAGGAGARILAIVVPRRPSSSSYTVVGRATPLHYDRSVAESAVAILRGGAPLDLVAHGGEAEAVAAPATGSHHRSMHRIRLDAGGETKPLRHASEAVYFVAEGAGAVGDHQLKAHDMVYVPRRTGYAFTAASAMTIYGGPCPPDPALYGDGDPAQFEDDGEGPVRVFDADTEGVPLPTIGKGARLVVWPGVGADIATMNMAILEPGEENQPHAHAESDDTIAILEGEGSIDDLDAGTTHDFSAGDVVFVRAGARHKVKADRGVRIVSAGGPCPPDYGMLRALGLV
jgi:quercetin dioxygenase-like cupin family protein